MTGDEFVTWAYGLTNVLRLASYAPQRRRLIFRHCNLRPAARGWTRRESSASRAGGHRARLRTQLR